MSLKPTAATQAAPAFPNSAHSGALSAPLTGTLLTSGQQTNPRFELIQGGAPSTLALATRGDRARTASFKVSTRSPLHVVVQGPSAPESALGYLKTLLRPAADTVRLPSGALHGDAFRLHDVSSDAADYDLAKEFARSASLDIAQIPDDRHIDDLQLVASDVDYTLIDGDFLEKLVELKGDPQADELAWREDIVESMLGRVAALAGIPMDHFHEVGEEMMDLLMPGAREFLDKLSPQARVVLLSSGFTQFVERLRDKLRATHVHANRLLTRPDEVHTEVLTGEMDGPFLDGEIKEQLFRRYHGELPDGARSAAIGDGENDIPMLGAAVQLGGVGAAFRPRYDLGLLPPGVDVIKHSGYDALGNLYMGIEEK